ncbi:hypothetical protein [Oceanicola sp. 22II-s10i]|nr:hypothetical protein [Oceanicola sp. 22II-s10i]
MRDKFLVKTLIVFAFFAGAFTAPVHSAPESDDRADVWLGFR